MSERSSRPSSGSVEPGEPGSTEKEPRTLPYRRYSLEQRKRILAELAEGRETMTAYCDRTGISSATICSWKRLLKAHGESGLAPQPCRGNPSGVSGPRRTPEERRAIIEAFERAGTTMHAFARTFGMSPWTLRDWVYRYRAEGPKGLEPRKSGPKTGNGRLPRTSAPVREEIARTKRRFPEFGLKKVRDFLRRFQGIDVSTKTVARTLDEHGIERDQPLRKQRRKTPRPRRFERARPGELWQSDITSFVLSRPGTRVYLVVFLDDFSRFVVSFGLHVQMSTSTVCEVLLEGVSRYGKPGEVLTDQGPQYFAWRGKSAFQKLLVREGIRHVVARSHHPQTVGKCERLWETVGREFWERARPQDLADARERLMHFISHYNFFRPHQGIEGAVPADRFFGAQDALRSTIESRLSKRELDLALQEVPRKSVYLFGQVGDEQVSVVGERGEIHVHTSSGVRQRIGLEELGVSRVSSQGVHDAERGERNGTGGRRGEKEARERQETSELRPASEVSPRSERALEERHGGGAGGGAPHVHATADAVAREEASRGGGGRTVGTAAAGLATESASAGGDARGTLAPAALASAGQGEDHGGIRGRPAQAEEGAGGEGQADRRPAGADQAPYEHPEAPLRGTVGRGGADTGDENAPSPSNAPA